MRHLICTEAVEESAGCGGFMFNFVEFNSKNSRVCSRLTRSLRGDELDL